MTDRHEGGAPGGAGGPVDHEIDFRGILVFVGGLAAVSLVVLALMWGIATFFKGSLVKKDPAPAALAEARETRVPPGPNLQSNPSADMAAFRVAEDLELAKWAWVDNVTRGFSSTRSIFISNENSTLAASTPPVIGAAAP